MRRREFVAALGGALAWPVAASAQQPAMSVVGWLSGGSKESDAYRVAAVKRGLAEAGFVEGRNILFEYQWAGNQYDRLPVLVSNLVARRVAVIVTNGNAAGIAAYKVSAAIPIVFQVGGDPISLGLAQSLARPGGNATGVTFLGSSLAPKLFEVLRESVPHAEIIGFLENPANPNAETVRNEVQSAAKAFSKKLIVAQAVVEQDFAPAFQLFIRSKAEAVLVRNDLLFNERPQQLVALANLHKIPTIFGQREFALAGGLMSYGASIVEAYRQAGVYAGRVLKGEKPAELPIMQATKVELVINLKAARALGLDMPQTLLARADEVIE